VRSREREVQGEVETTRDAAGGDEVAVVDDAGMGEQQRAGAHGGEDATVAVGLGQQRQPVAALHLTPRPDVVARDPPVGRRR